MNADELKAALQVYYDNYDSIGIFVYAVLKCRENASPVKVDIENEASDGLKKLFVEALKTEISKKDDLSVLSLSSSDERRNAIYVYDLEEVPAELSALETVISKNGLPPLNLNDHGLASIKALLIEIGNSTEQIVLYKTMASVNIFGRANNPRYLFLKKSERRLKRLDDEFLRVSAGFQMLRINGKLLIMDLEALERSFGFHDVIKREAAAGIISIERASIVENPDVLRELLDDIKYARRLTKVAKASPVLQASVPGSEIVRFCKTFPKLKGKIKFNDAEDKIVLDTKISKDLFIKLLMDDFLTSELTKFRYASVAKDNIDQEAE
jgi:hypothetical protein